MYFLVKSYFIIDEADWKQVNLKGSQFQLSATRKILRNTFKYIKAGAPRAHKRLFTKTTLHKPTLLHLK